MPSLFDPSMTGSGAAPSGGGFSMDPMTMMAIGQGVGAIGQGLMGSGDPVLSNLHLVNSGQQALWNQMAQRALSGQGDYGYGAAAKSAKGQIQGMLESRGISQDSGLGMQALAQGYGAAAAQDAQNRRNTQLSILGTPLQTAQTAGANLIPGSPSAGYSQGAQEGSWNAYQQTGKLPSGGGIGTNQNFYWGANPYGQTSGVGAGGGQAALYAQMGRRSGTRPGYGGVGNG